MRALVLATLLAVFPIADAKAELLRGRSYRTRAGQRAFVKEKTDPMPDTGWVFFIGTIEGGSRNWYAWLPEGISADFNHANDIVDFWR